MHLLGRHRKIWIAALCVLMGLTLAQIAVPPIFAEETQAEKDRQRMLNREADDGFYSGRVRLNVWRVTAIEAGKFDPQKYEEFKKQLYEKSVAESLRCFEYFIEQNSHHDANMCLQTWKMHAKEVDMFDESAYQELLKRLSDIKEKKLE
jgi:CRISPR/Cas system-associated protein Cas7 (RAMP superfamily)